MDEEDEKKIKKREKRREWGEHVGSIIQVIKYLKNPIIRYIAIGIVILLLLIGIISFIVSIPGNILGNIADSLKNLFKEENPLEVKQEELIELCKYLEEMGYDLEAYGFVEEITRSGEKTYQDDEFDINADGSQNITRGEIINVKSKYLEAYLVAEKKTYLVADPGYQNVPWYYLGIPEVQAFFEDEVKESEYRWNCMNIAVQMLFDDIWPVNGEPVSYLKEAIDAVYSFDKTDRMYKLNYKENEKLGLPTLEHTILSPEGYYVRNMKDVDEIADKFKSFGEDDLRKNIKSIFCTYWPLHNKYTHLYYKIQSGVLR